MTAPETVSDTPAVTALHQVEETWPPYSNVTVFPEIRRLMRPGGKLRIEVSNGKYLVDQYLAARAGRSEEIVELQRHGRMRVTMLKDRDRVDASRSAMSLYVAAEAAASKR